MPKSAAPKTASTVQSNLADRIAQDIQAGMYGPGAWLKQIDLQDRYGAKRLDVRRALDQLAGKRLITHIPNRGYHVFAMDPQRHEELREIRLLLETGAAADLMNNVTASKLRLVKQLAERFNGLLKTGTLLEQYEVNLAFHAAVYDMCRNRELAALILEMRSRGPSAVAREWVTHARIEKSAREHFEMVEAIEANDVKRLQKVITAHINQDVS
ncbi:transcriptional regulator [Bordetella genomosp. 1]|uniref:Transcriptional regulator n=1 Tax=Bordetella genomosp. 1 TaxID=1395607 RepID=A0A261RVU1_9BORD|nr:GntR family transcriptional regulator [Bordetella genomosp. 1]MDQ8032420.1 GntR family transcriptional regulator [Bordetella sp.]OZI29199.1 transcriptional regulator [Bordetella genomosp. 1]OZI65067.1 transcriptional regulator [Bordetella genomosp. 1]